MGFVSTEKKVQEARQAVQCSRQTCRFNRRHAWRAKPTRNKCIPTQSFIYYPLLDCFLFFTSFTTYTQPARHNFSTRLRRIFVIRRRSWAENGQPQTGHKRQLLFSPRPGHTQTRFTCKHIIHSDTIIQQKIELIEPSHDDWSREAGWHCPSGGSMGLRLVWTPLPFPLLDHHPCPTRRISRWVLSLRLCLHTLQERSLDGGGTS